jgi:transcriptional regulator with XRE-family HTH domain
MNSRANVKAFGERVAQLRLGKGLTQKEVLARMPGTYADENSYGRIEHGARKPSRDIAVAILARGLALQDAAEVDAALAILGYDGLTLSELQGFGLEGRPEARPTKAFERSVILERVSWSVLALALTLSAWIVIHFDRTQAGFTLTTCILYAGLYVISLFLETVYEGGAYRSLSLGVTLFSGSLLHLWSRLLQTLCWLSPAARKAFGSQWSFSLPLAWCSGCSFAVHCPIAP